MLHSGSSRAPTPLQLPLAVRPGPESLPVPLAVTAADTRAVTQTDPASGTVTSLRLALEGTNTTGPDSLGAHWHWQAQADGDSESRAPSHAHWQPQAASDSDSEAWEPC